MTTPRLVGPSGGEAAPVSVAELLEDPRRVGDLPIEAIPATLARCAALLAALSARMAAGDQDARPAPQAATDGGSWLSAAEAAGIARVGVRWLRAHADEIPGDRRFSRKRLRFHEGRFRRWLEKGLDPSARRPLLEARNPP